MGWIVAGRLIQGFDGGLEVASAYVVVRRTFPEPVWSRTIALMTTVWSMSVLIEPHVRPLWQLARGIRPRSRLPIPVRLHGENDVYLDTVAVPAMRAVEARRPILGNLESEIRLPAAARFPGSRRNILKGGRYGKDGSHCIA